jgi:hypothetical protein
MIALALLDLRGDSFIARAPTSVVLVRDAGNWKILKDHSG